MLANYQMYNLGVSLDRAILHERIAQRFSQMLTEGFLDEVKSLVARGDLNLEMPSMRSVGYRQVWEYLLGNYSYDEMCEKGIIATRQLAKRQLTWLRHWPLEIQWFDSLANDLFTQVEYAVQQILKI
jgi:tRNA dimethylallyltransferase